MKKSYILVVLLLLGFGIVTTMAFSSGTANENVVSPISVSTQGGEHITDVVVYPYTGANGLRIEVTLSPASAAWTGYIQVLDGGSELLADSGETYSVTGATTTNTAAWDSDFGMVKITTAGGSYTTLTIKLTKSGLWTNGDEISIVEASQTDA